MLWLKGDAGVLDASGNPATNGVAVKTWQDQSGNGNHATQATVGLMPTFVSSGVNGKPMVRFNISHAMRSSIVLPQPFTIFLVSADRNTIITGNGYGVQLAADADGDAVGWDNANDLFLYGTSGFQFAASRDQLFHTHTYTAASGSGTIYYDGVSLGSGATNCSWPNLNLGFDGNSTYYNQDYAEIIMYPSVLTGSALTNTLHYLKLKYNTP